MGDDTNLSGAGYGSRRLGKLFIYARGDLVCCLVSNQFQSSTSCHKVMKTGNNHAGRKRGSWLHRHVKCVISITVKVNTMLLKDIADAGYIGAVDPYSRRRPKQSVRLRV